MSVHYFDAGMLPVNYGVCFSEADFKKEMKRIKDDDPPPWLQGSFPATLHRWSTEEGPAHLILCFDVDRAKDWQPFQVYSLLAHEAVHAAQFTFEEMQEDGPGTEVEAYAVQWFAQCAMQEYERVGQTNSA